jgi:hypothetical protein
MKTSQTITAIAPAIVKALGKLDDVVKGETAKVKSKSTGTEYTYKFATLADGLKIARPVLAECGLAMLQPFTIAADRAAVLIETTLLHESGEYFAETLSMPLPQHAGHQEIGSTVSYGRRYHGLAFLNMATEDDDADAASRGARRDDPPQQREESRGARESRGRGQRRSDAPEGAQKPQAPAPQPSSSATAPTEAPSSSATAPTEAQVATVKRWESSISEATSEENLVFRYKRAYGEVFAYGFEELTRRIIAAKDKRKVALGIAEPAPALPAPTESAPAASAPAASAPAPAELQPGAQA